MKKEKFINILNKINILEKQKTAFTLIELLVSITIIILISSSWIFYFIDYVKQQEINQKTQFIIDNISQLNKDIKNYKILDYEILFSTQENKNKSYITNINSFDSTNQNLELNDSTGSWIIKAIWTWTWLIKIYENDKLFISKIIDKSLDYEYNFDKYQNYKILWSYSWSFINDIYLTYISEQNIPKISNNITKINYINTKQDKSWTNIINLKISNIWWKISFYNNSTILNENQIYIFFENNWNEKYIEIKK